MISSNAYLSVKSSNLASHDVLTTPSVTLSATAQNAIFPTFKQIVGIMYFWQDLSKDFSLTPCVCVSVFVAARRIGSLRKWVLYSTFAIRALKAARLQPAPPLVLPPSLGWVTSEFYYPRNSPNVIFDLCLARSADHEVSGARFCDP